MGLIASIFRRLKHCPIKYQFCVYVRDLFKLWCMFLFLAQRHKMWYFPHAVTVERWCLMWFLNIFPLDLMWTCLMHVTCSRRHDNKASVSRHNAAAAAAPSPSLDSTNHVDASLKTCVESLSAVRRLHKDLASHIEVSDAYILIIISLEAMLQLNIRFTS